MFLHTEINKPWGISTTAPKKSKTKTRDYVYILQHRCISEVLGPFKDDEHERGHSLLFHLFQDKQNQL